MFDDSTTQYDPQNDYLNLFGLSVDFDLPTLKSARNKLVKQYHSDVGGQDEAKIRLINVAFEVLSDPQKRVTYMQNRRAAFSRQAHPRAHQQGYGGGYGGYGHSRQQSGAQQGPFDLDDIFADLFGGGRARRGGGQQQRQYRGGGGQQQRQQYDPRYNGINVDFINQVLATPIANIQPKQFESFAKQVVKLPERSDRDLVYDFCVKVAVQRRDLDASLAFIAINAAFKDPANLKANDVFNQVLSKHPKGFNASMVDKFLHNAFKNKNHFDRVKYFSFMGALLHTRPDLSSAAVPRLLEFLANEPSPQSTGLLLQCVKAQKGLSADHINWLASVMANTANSGQAATIVNFMDAYLGIKDAKVTTGFARTVLNEVLFRSGLYRGSMLGSVLDKMQTKFDKLFTAKDVKACIQQTQQLPAHSSFEKSRHYGIYKKLLKQDQALGDVMMPYVLSDMFNFPSLKAAVELFDDIVKANPRALSADHVDWFARAHYQNAQLHPAFAPQRAAMLKHVAKKFKGKLSGQLQKAIKNAGKPPKREGFTFR